MKIFTIYMALRFHGMNADEANTLAEHIAQLLEKLDK